jgi:hypothetical protein
MRGTDSIRKATHIQTNTNKCCVGGVSQRCWTFEFSYYRVNSIKVSEVATLIYSNLINDYLVGLQILQKT